MECGELTVSHAAATAEGPAAPAGGFAACAAAAASVAAAAMAAVSPAAAVMPPAASAPAPAAEERPKCHTPPSVAFAQTVDLAPAPAHAAAEPTAEPAAAPAAGKSRFRNPFAPPPSAAAERSTADRSTTPSSGAGSSGGGFSRPRADPRHYSWSPGGAIHTGLRRFKLPINQIRNELDEKIDLRALPTVPITPGGATPIKRGFVRCITDRWVDTHTHTTAGSMMNLLRGSAPPEKYNSQSARIVGTPSYSGRRKIVGDHIEEKLRGDDDQRPGSLSARSPVAASPDMSPGPEE